ATFTGAPGRLERVYGPSSDYSPAVFVDYAHTPDALENVSSTLREVCDGRRLLTVFGSGGDRARTNCPMLGGNGGRRRDAVVDTSDTQRTEDADYIIDEVWAGVRGQLPASHAVDAEVWVEPDPVAAGCLGRRMAGLDEVVLIAGKGHE